MFYEDYKFEESSDSSDDDEPKQKVWTKPKISQGNNL